MKLFCLIILPVILLIGCTNTNKKPINNVNELAYSSGESNSGPLSVTFALSGDLPHQDLISQLKLTNSSSSSIDIQEIIISTTDGLRSLPKTGNISFSLKPGADSSLSIKFKPINDLKIYRITGTPGIFKPAYNVLISYQIAGSNDPITMALKSQTDKKTYQDYIKKYKKRITGYSFNTKTGFNENQKKYMETLKISNQPAFVYISEQEIAISGLNFRLTGYYQQDTLHAELFIVNNAGFPLRFIPGQFDFTVDRNKNNAETSTITVEKISGSQQDKDLLEKGDRLLIHFKKYMEIKEPGNDILLLHLHRAFILPDSKKLFYGDIQLLSSDNTKLE